MKSKWIGVRDERIVSLECRYTLFPRRSTLTPPLRLLKQLLSSTVRDMIDFEIINTTDQEIDSQAIKAGLQAAQKKLNSSDQYFVSIEVVKPEESQRLNQTLRHTNEPTDCLSISTQEQERGKQIIEQQSDGSLTFSLDQQTTKAKKQWPVLGQLILCLAIISRNATEAGQSLDRELEWVVEHGVLHLAGYHHDETH